MLGDCPRESVCRYAQGTRERCRAGQVQSDDKGLTPAVGSRSKLKSLHLADGATATHGWSLAQSKGNTPYRCGVVSILIQRTCAREAKCRKPFQHIGWPRMQNPTLEKLCPACGLSRPLGEFFSAGYNSRAAETRTGRYCKECHSAGDIKHGYGWSGYSEQFATPESTVA